MRAFAVSGWLLALGLGTALALLLRAEHSDAAVLGGRERLQLQPLEVSGESSPTLKRPSYEGRTKVAKRRPKRMPPWGSEAVH